MHRPWDFGKEFVGPGGFLGRFGRGIGGGMRAARMLASGDLQLIILALLQEKPRHGYEIIKALEEHSSGIYTPSPGVVYPALTYLEEAGLAVSEADGNKKLYRITESGTQKLEKNRELVDETLDQLGRFGRKMARVQRHFTDDAPTEEGPPRREHEDKSESVPAWQKQKNEWHQMKSDLRDLKHQLKSAIFEKFDGTPEERIRIVGILRKAIAEIRGTPM